MRELADLRKKVHEAIDAGGGAEQLVRDRVMVLWSRTRRAAPAPPAEDGGEHAALVADDPAPVDSRADWFARELGDTWVEVEPGIYEHSAQPLPGPALRLARG